MSEWKRQRTWFLPAVSGGLSWRWALAAAGKIPMVCHIAHKADFTAGRLAEAEADFAVRADPASHGF